VPFKVVKLLDGTGLNLKDSGYICPAGTMFLGDTNIIGNQKE
jgi:hypothetical protein